MHRIVSYFAAAALAALLASGGYAQSAPRGEAGTDTGTGEGRGTAVGPETRGGGTEAGRTGESTQGEGVASEGPQHGKGETLTVLTVREQEKQIVAQSAAGAQKTVVLGQDTQIRRHGRSGGEAKGAIELGDIEPGDRILVIANPVQGNRLTAQRIEVIESDVGAGGPGMGPGSGTEATGEEGRSGSGMGIGSGTGPGTGRSGSGTD
jgi:hypothetical protein